MELKVWILKQGYSLNWIEYTRKWVGGAVEREKKSKREKREGEGERERASEFKLHQDGYF